MKKAKANPRAASRASVPRATISDVARRAGVSITSVSRALNLPRDQSRISVGTHRMILDAARELGYRPNWSAQSLARGRTGNIGLLYVGNNPLFNPVFGHLSVALSQTLRANHYRLLLLPVEADEQTDWRSVLEQGRVDGCVVATPGLPPEVMSCLVQRRIPSVLINIETDLPLPQVLADDRDGIRQVTQHLFDLGHRRIAYLYSPRPYPRPSVTIRRDGFLAVMSEAGLSSQASVHLMESAQFAGEIATAANRPTAVICYSHVEAADLYHAMWQRGLLIPRDLSVIAFNNLYPTEVMQPPLTVMQIPFAEIGQLSAERLLKSLSGASGDDRDDEAPASPLRVLLPERLIIRHSTAENRGPTPFISAPLAASQTGTPTAPPDQSP